jgi:hypothetical protein
MTHQGGITGSVPPGTIKDGYGNLVRFSVSRPEILHLEDQLGGFADVDWSGPAPVLVASRAMVRSTSARVPTLRARRLVNVGHILLLVSPLLAWLLLSAAIAGARSGRRSWTATARLYLSCVLQTAGLVLVVLAATVPHSPGDQGMGKAMLFLLAFAASGMGLLLMSAALLRIALHAEVCGRWLSGAMWRRT